MLKYRINKQNTDITKSELNVNSIEFVDFATDVTEYQGINSERQLLICKCDNLYNLHQGSSVNTLNTLYLNYGGTENQETSAYTFDKDYQISGLNEDENTFSIFINKNHQLKVTSIQRNSYIDDDSVTGDNIYLYFETPHYFDVTDENITLYFRYANNNGNIITTIISNCQFLSYNSLIIGVNHFPDELYRIVFKQNKNDYISEDVFEGNIGGIEIYRDNFLFESKTNYSFYLERNVANIQIPITNTFDSNLLQDELLNEYFVEDEERKAINKIVDIEKDVYYPSIYAYDSKNGYAFSKDVYTIKFNLHFREHRGDNWLVDNASYWNGVNADGTLNEKITKSDSSDLLSFLDFTNDDVHYQKNRLKKSFLRLSYYDSPNQAIQNLLGYSTVFYNTGELFAKYIKYAEEGYTTIITDKNEYGKYDTSSNKKGIKIDREHDFDDKYRLSSQLVIKNKNLSKNSSEGFYLYLWKGNETTIPQDIYMKIEFNHAGYGRIIPFMIPFNDKNKHKDKIPDGSFKSFEQILNDFAGKNECISGEAYDGPYGIRQYLKYSYIHLKYCYDKENDIHRYFIDPKTYGKQTDGNEIVINLYEAKIS